MTGSNYRTTQWITNSDGDVLAEIGATCEKVPADALTWLIEQQIAVSVLDASPPPAPVTPPAEVDEDPADDAANDRDDENEGL